MSGFALIISHEIFPSASPRCTWAAVKDRHGQKDALKASRLSVHYLSVLHRIVHVLVELHLAKNKVSKKLK